ncbi:MAG: hypothetical protein CME71_01080 [Halobacteriovorax sp.]|nr:hypothetical protein [Halobacteriovorax sp.]
MRSPSIENKKNVNSNRQFKARISIPSSKSRANRMLFLAAITPGEVTLSNIPDSSDVTDMLKCLKVLGLNMTTPTHGQLVIHNSFPECEKESDQPIIVECGYGGTTTRFLAALLVLGCNTYHLEASGHMRDRPMSEMIEPLTKLGARIEHNRNGIWLLIKGPVKNKLELLEVDAARSTQFASAVAMTMSLWNGKVSPLNLSASEEYLKMTEDAIEQCKNHHWAIPLDFSSLSYAMGLAAICGEVEITNFKSIDTFQPDCVFIEILKNIGARVDFGQTPLKVSLGALSSWEGDCSGFPDLVPTLAFVLAYADGTSKLKNLSVLQHKESDRLSEICKILSLNEISHQVAGDTLLIQGGSFHANKVIYEAPDDHRMIMMAALFMKVNGGGEIVNYEHVKKSYPFFFEDVIES